MEMMRKEDHYGIVENPDSRTAEEALDSHRERELGSAAGSSGGRTFPKEDPELL